MLIYFWVVVKRCKRSSELLGLSNFVCCVILDFQYLFYVHLISKKIKSWIECDHILFVLLLSTCIFTLQYYNEKNKQTFFQVKLIDTSDIFVDRKLKRKAVEAAKKKPTKAAYILMYKLLDRVFSIEELASSRGQGIGRTSTDDVRPVLDKNKMDALKGKVVFIIQQCTFCRSK